MLELQLRIGAGTGVGAILQYHRRPTGVSVEQQQGLIVAFDTARHYVLPLRANLEVQQGEHTHINIHISTHTQTQKLNLSGYNIMDIPPKSIRSNTLMYLLLLCVLISIILSHFITSLKSNLVGTDDVKDM